MANNKLTFEELKTLIINRFGADIVVGEKADGLQAYLNIKPGQIAELCQFLHSDPQCYFDFMACITGLDNGPEVNTMEVIYNLNSIPYEHAITLKVVLPREKPEVPTLSHIWGTANWHEREAYDLLGILFTGHPDLRRILLPVDWEGHPLQKDYKEQEHYHGIQVKL